MGSYVGAISLRNGFANYKPLYKYDEINQTFEELQSWERQELLPESQMQDINFKLTDRQAGTYFYPNECYLFKFEVSGLEVVPGQRTGYRCDVTNLLGTDVLRPVSEIGLYYVVQESQLDGDLLKDQILNIDDEHVFDNLEVLISRQGDNRVLYGPFTVHVQNNNVPFIDTNLAQRKYVFPAVKFPTYYTDPKYQLDMSPSPQNVEELWYVHIDKFCKDASIDVISDAQLLKEFRTRLSDSDFTANSISVDDLDAVLDHYKSSFFEGQNLPEEFKSKRLRRLHEIITDESNVVDAFGFIADDIAALLTKYQDTEEYRKLVEKLISDPDIASRIQGLEIVTTKIETEQAKVEALVATQKKLNEDIEQAKNLQAQRNKEYEESLVGAFEDQLQKMREEKEALEKEMAKKRESIKDLGDAATLKSQLEKLKDDIK